MKEHSTLISNGANSIRLGIEDYKQNDNSRLVSAVRNIYAGILLVLKEKLRRLSPVGSDEVLIKSKIIPVLDDSGEVFFVGKGVKTITLQEIEERFTCLGIVADFKSIKEIQVVRNNLEHYCLQDKKGTDSHQLVRKVLAKCCRILDVFLNKELKVSPAELLGEVWSDLIQIQEVYDLERQQMVADFERISSESKSLLEALLEYAICPSCDSDLIKVIDDDFEGSDNVVCVHCSDKFDLASMCCNALDLHLDNGYFVAKDGEEPNLEQCPQCFRETFVVAEDKCPLCGYTREYHRCNICGTELSVEEQRFGGLCSYHDYVMSKDD